MFDYTEYMSPQPTDYPHRFQLRRIYEFETYCPVCFDSVDKGRMVISCYMCLQRVHLGCCSGIPLPSKHIGMRCKACRQTD